MKFVMKKNMTIEDLAIMIQGKFKEIYARFDRVDERLDRIEFNQISQERRISILEDGMRIISTKLGLDLRRA